MNNGIIVYGSCYGTTKRYAEELSKKTGIEAKPYEDIRDINSFDTIIYMGGLYAGGVCGMKKTMKKLGSISDKRVFIVTVGLADPMNTETPSISRIGCGLSFQKKCLKKPIFII
jgi:flavodoxin